MNSRCRACGAPVDGDVCDSWCESVAQAEYDAKQESDEQDDAEPDDAELCWL